MKKACVAANQIYAKRKVCEDDHAFRSKFSRDRDRILYSKAFRQLSGKTQVFVAGYDEVLRTRLTHTLEVAQIAKTIGYALSLDIELIEAISLGHDIGHTPFGHVGERCLNYVMNNCDDIKSFTANVEEDNKGFKHNFQSIRMLSFLEKSYNKSYSGLNLTDYTLWGILNHSSINSKKCDCSYKTNPITCSYMLSNKICPNAGTILKYTFYDRYIKDTIGENSWTVEALVVAIADEIAQRHHDVEDGLIAKIINKEMLSERIREYFKDVLTDNNIMLLDLICCENDDTVIHSAYSKLIVDIMVNDVIEGTRTKINKMCCKYSIKTNVDFNVYKGYIPVDEVLGLVCFSEIFKSGEGKLHNFLKDKILKSHIVQVMDGKATYIIRQLFKAYITNPQQLPDDVIVKFFEEMLPGLNRKGLLSTTDISRLRENLEYNFRTNSRKKYRQYLSRAICDYIASMTDNMAYQQYEILYGATKVPL